MRFGIAAAAVATAVAPAPLAAQDAVAITPSAPSEDSIGPSQLRDFSLDGTVVRRAEPAQQRNAPPPASERPSSATATTSREASTPAPVQERAEQVRSAAAQQEPQREATVRAEPAQVAASGSSVPFDLAPPSPADPMYDAAPVLAGTLQPPSSSSSYVPASAVPDSGGGFLSVPWMLAILLLGGAAAYYFRRQRPGLAFAGAAEAMPFASSDPVPTRQPRPAPTPAPPPPPAAPVGIVSTRLRPQLKVQFAPLRLAVQADRVILEYEALVLNAGSAPARDLLVEAAMFNAGPDQDQQIATFFERPAGEGDRVASVEPLKSLAFKSALVMPRESLRLFQAGDRTVFVPVVGFNLHYRWSSSEGQTASAFLVGKATGSEKLAPFRVDQDARVYTGLDLRELDNRLRK